MIVWVVSLLRKHVTQRVSHRDQLTELAGQAEISATPLQFRRQMWTPAVA